jgi:hypothetical protein
MARYHGKNGKAVVDGVDQVNEVSDWTIDSSRTLADASQMGEDDTRKLPGQKTHTATITCSHDPADTDGQEALVTAHENGTIVTLTLYEIPSATGVKYWSGDFWVEKWGEKVPVGGKIERTFSLTSEGAVTRQTVA